MLTTTPRPDDARPAGVLDQVRSIDLLPRYPRPVEGKNDSVDDRRPAEYYGTAAEANASAGATAGQGTVPPVRSAGSEGYDLNFENAPLANVAKVVLGDILGAGYTIDPRVQGTVTLASGRPISKADILFVLENALRISNVALVREPGGYRLIPLVEAVGAGNLDRGGGRAEPGYGLSVIPLQYVSAQTLIKLLDGFATRAGSVRADTGRNLLLIQGSGAERRAAIDTVLSFDADWMRGQSVGIYPIRNGTPEPVIAELEKVMDSGEGGMSQSLVKFQPIERMNAVLVVARKPELLRTAATWINRLDRADTTAGVKVYRVRYGEARQMAKVLNDIFIGGSSNTLDQATNQVAPGSGLSVSTSGTSNGFGGSNGTSSMPSRDSVRQRLGMTLDKQGDARSATQPDSQSLPSGAPGGSGPMLQGVRITPDVVNNTLLIYASQENYRVIERTLRQIDRPQMQVAIDATVAEVTLNDTLNYGVQFFLTSSDLGLGKNKGSMLNTGANQPPTVDTAGVTSAFLNRAYPGFNFLVGPENQPRLILDALHAITNVKVLSNPSLVVIDNQVATLQVGDEVPVSTGSAAVLNDNNTIVNTIDYRNTGIILRVVPRINVNGNVRLDIEQEISNVANTETSATLTPTVSQRKVKSSVTVASGQTVLLAGLISETHNGDRSGIPGLNQLPGLLGDAFSHRTKSISRTELIIFIRPQIIRDSVDAHVVAEELRTKMRGSISVAPGGPVQPNIR
jgi:general secretion pathway protein D